MTGSPMAMPMRIMHRWRQRMSGIELSILFCATAFALLVLPRASVAPVLSAMPPAAPLPLWDMAGLTVLHVILSLLIVVAASLLLSGAACQWPRFRAFLIPALSVARAVPGLGLIGILAALFPPTLTIMLVAASSMIWRIVTAVLDAEDTLPPALDEVATGLRMTGWQRFWRLQMPVAVPLTTFRAMQAMPAFWVRLLSAEGLMMLMSHQATGGCGAAALQAMLDHHPLRIVEVSGIILLLILVIDQALMRPMVGWAQRYRPEGPFEERARPQSWLLTIWRRTKLMLWLSGGVSDALVWIGNWRLGRPRSILPERHRTVRELPEALLPVVSLFLLVYAVYHAGLLGQVPADLAESVLTLSHVCGTLLLCVLVWVPLGLVISEHGSSLRNVCRMAVMACGLFPAVLLYPLCRELGLDSPVILLFLGAHWLVGIVVLDAAKAIPSGLRQVAAGLRLRGVLLWRRLLLPAIAPELCGGLLTAVVPVWNAVMVAEAFVPSDSGLGAALLSEALSGAVAAQILALMLLTLLSMLLDRLVLQPLAVNAAQKYTI
ncbi:ABC transporter permease subunit [Gluconobacter oxydans]|uniref:ABC transporter permease subunit n=1 Tax=Gluconobacter oxydans TaxID=442 RepID=UPI0007857EC0|nr:ABC transporter permease subunit [Gluconobacter oxydans]KXV11336.1 transporter [Gluconobacter oxydans]WKE48165.1 transporter [Gluconobacter oxydans]